MYEIVWQYDETAPFADEGPADAAAARQMLREGNDAFARFFDPHRAPGETTRHVVCVSAQDVGISGKPGEPPTQEPFAAFLSCADSRVPVELIFGQQANDLFVVRVVGNVLGDECLASLDFAVEQLGTVRLLAVLGHTGCGAITAAVDAYLAPTGYLAVAINFPLQTIINSIMAPVRSAALALATVYGPDVANHPGYRPAMIETAVMLNAAYSSVMLTHTFADRLGDRLQVSFGVYDLRRRTVGLPDETGQWQVGLSAPPTSEEAFAAFARLAARSRLVGDFLK